jgi:hypothetical protein
MRPVTTAEQEPGVPGKAPPMSKDMAEFFRKYSAENTKVEVEIVKSVDLPLNWD